MFSVHVLDEGSVNPSGIVGTNAAALSGEVASEKISPVNPLNIPLVAAVGSVSNSDGSSHSHDRLDA